MAPPPKSPPHSSSGSRSPLGAAGLAALTAPCQSAPSQPSRAAFGISALREKTAAVEACLGEEKQTLQDAGLNMDTLRIEIARLESRLKKELRPQLADASGITNNLGQRADSLRNSLAALSQARQAAAEQVGQLSKRQLSEIKQLRNPPDAVRRTLSASWLLLHSERFRGKPVRFDDSKDWPRCQRMMADDGFVGRVLDFDAAILDDVPSVPLHVATSYFGFLPAEDSVSSSLRPPEAVSSGPPDPPQSAMGSRPPPPHRSSTSQSLGRRSSAPAVKAPLQVDDVAKASQPCGALVRWMQELVAEHVERTRVQKELSVTEEDLGIATKRLVTLEHDVAEVESTLARLRALLAQREDDLQRLAKEQTEAQKAAADLQALTNLTKMTSAAAPKKPKPKAAPPAPQEEKVEVEVSGTLAMVQTELAKLQIRFKTYCAGILEGDPQHALNLPRIADILKQHRGQLKLLIEGHATQDESKEIAIERSLAVYKWLVEIAGCTPGLLRIKSCGSTGGMGTCAVAVPIVELAATKGPMTDELAGGKTKPGLFFAQSSADLLPSTKAILAEMAKCLIEDEYTVRVEGHTDSEEADELALRRARAVREAFVSLGVSKSLLRQAESCKSLHPVSRRQQAANRRVEIHVD